MNERAYKISLRFFYSYLAAIPFFVGIAYLSAWGFDAPQSSLDNLSSVLYWLLFALNMGFCIFHAKAKGYSNLIGLLCGLVGVGFILLLLMPDRAMREEQEGAQSEGEQREPEEDSSRKRPWDQAN